MDALVFLLMAWPPLAAFGWWYGKTYDQEYFWALAQNSTTKETTTLGFVFTAVFSWLWFVPLALTQILVATIAVVLACVLLIGSIVSGSMYMIWFSLHEILWKKLMRRLQRRIARFKRSMPDFGDFIDS